MRTIRSAMYSTQPDIDMIVQDILRPDERGAGSAMLPQTNPNPPHNV